MARETGSGVTPQRVVDELNKMLLETSLNAISKATGIGISALHRYREGIGEPTTASLKKLADFFGVRVRYLQGGPIEPLDRFLEGLRIGGFTAETFNRILSSGPPEDKDLDHWEIIVHDGNFPLGVRKYLCMVFGINAYWVETGKKPVGDCADIVGTLTPPDSTPWGIDFDNYTPDEPVTVECAKCGGMLRVVSENFEPIRAMPCETCCK